MSSLRSLRIVAASFLALGACASEDPRRSAPPSAAAGPPVPIEMSIGHTDARLGLPSFVWITGRDLPRFDTATEAARTTLRGLAPRLSLAPAAVASLGDAEIHDLGRGPIVARFRQVVDGVEVFRGGLAVVMNRTFEPVAASGIVVPRLAGSEAAFTLDPAAAVRIADHVMTGADPVVHADRVDAEYTHFTGDPALSLARARRVFYPVAGGLVPGWHVELMQTGGAAMSYVVSAADGEVLFSTSLLHHDAYTYRVWADAATKIPMDGPQGNATIPHPTGKPDRFRPTLVPSQLVTLQNYPFSRNDPWLPAGAGTTTGNNVKAYADLSLPDGLGSTAPPLDVQPPVASPNTLDFTYDPGANPAAKADNIGASVTQLFYTLNFLHDWFYDAGFDEKSGNHQAQNFGRGGKEGDALDAAAIDYGGRNNANAATPADGASPRIQMFVFSGPSVTATLTVQPPSAVAGDKAVGLAGFGLDQFDVTLPVAVANDGADPDPADACDGELTGSLSGKIALVHRGQCPFIDKARAVEAAGAKGIIVVNVASSADPAIAPFMGGTDSVTSPVRIPALSLAFADGSALANAAMAGTVSVRMRRPPVVDIDGALDAAIVAHEWGHVLSNRLVGNGSGLATNQARGLGEGWSDFVALMLLARPDDVETAAGKGFAGVYPKAAYATMGRGADYYFGIRRVPYSTDFTKNALTFKHIQNGTPLPAGVPVSFGEDGSFNAEVHATGEVWASMLWECYAALLAEGRLSFDEAQARMKRYLVAGLKMAPLDPTLVEARDAMLAATFAGDEKDFQVFYKAFARRGAGVGALGPPRESASNVGVTESFSVGNDVRIVSATLGAGPLTCDRDAFLDEGEVGAVEVVLRNVGIGTLNDTAVEFSTGTPGVAFPDDKGVLLTTSRTSVGPLKPFETRTVKVNTIVRGATKAPVKVDVRVTEPTLLVPRAITAAVEGSLNTDETPASSTADGMETKATTWKVTGPNGPQKWSRRTTPADGTFWAVPDQGYTIPVEHRLQSPSFTIDGTTFTLSFKHRHGFRRSRSRNVDVNGGVIELSTNGGTAWVDIATVSNVVYPGKIDPGGTGDNPLLKEATPGQGRKAYVGKTANYPAWVDQRIDVTLPVHPASVILRFRMGLSSGVRTNEDWDLDDVSLGGISSTPFHSFTKHADLCDANGPTVDAGPGRTVFVGDAVRLAGSGAHPKDLALTFEWTQVDGPPVVLGERTTAAPTFDAPPTPATLGFVVRANDGALVSPVSARVQVDVRAREPVPPVPAVAEGGCGCAETGRPASGAGSLAMGVIVALIVRRRSARGGSQPAAARGARQGRRRGEPRA